VCYTRGGWKSSLKGSNQSNCQRSLGFYGKQLCCLEGRLGSWAISSPNKSKGQRFNLAGRHSEGLTLYTRKVESERSLQHFPLKHFHFFLPSERQLHYLSHHDENGLTSEKRCGCAQTKTYSERLTIHILKNECSIQHKILLWESTRHFSVLWSPVNLANIQPYNWSTAEVLDRN